MKRPAIKDKTIISYIEYLEERLAKYEKSPYVKSYFTVLGQINDWNDQLTIKKIQIDGEGEKIIGRINLFGDASSKEFERAHKYFTEMKPYFEQLAYLRKMMTIEERDLIEKKLIKSEGVEEFILENEHK